MTVSELAQRLSAETIVKSSCNQEVKDYYVGDFLSNVMGRAQAGSAWFTVMTNVNVAGVASLADVACVVICEGNRPDPILVDRCQERDIPLLTTKKSAYAACIATV